MKTTFLASSVSDCKRLKYTSRRRVNYNRRRVCGGRRSPLLSSKARGKLRFLDRIRWLSQLLASPFVNFTPPMRLKSSISLVISVKHETSDNVEVISEPRRLTLRIQHSNAEQALAFHNRWLATLKLPCSIQFQQ